MGSIVDNGLRGGIVRIKASDAATTGIPVNGKAPDGVSTESASGVRSLFAKQQVPCSWRVIVSG
jgi:hypothetical protein